MLLENFINTKWNSKTKKYYESLGYKYTKMGDSFLVKVSDLKDNSSERVKIKCDYCGKEYSILWHHYVHKVGVGDACHDCVFNKAQITYMKKEGVKNPFLNKNVKQKIENTNIDKYGCPNPFGNKEIQDKIKQTNIIKYGCVYPTQCCDVIEKTKETCMERYGVESPMKTEEMKNRFKGERSPRWKGGKKDIRFERLSPCYKLWRDNVYKRDKYSCAKCNEVGGSLECHHILNFKDYPNERYNEENGITFCRKCHSNFHRLYGKSFNTKEQLIEFLNKDE